MSERRKARGGEPSGWDSLRRAHTDGAGNHRPAYLIRTEIVDALNRQQFRKLDACPVDAAFDRTDRAPANLSSFLAGEARGSHED